MYAAVGDYYILCLILALYKILHLKTDSKIPQVHAMAHSPSGKHFKQLQDLEPHLLMGLRCMKLQYPPRVHVFSSYCLQVASRKSVTGEKLTQDGSTSIISTHESLHKLHLSRVRMRLILKYWPCIKLASYCCKLQVQFLYMPIA